jgi:hypothetical protein
MLHVVLLKALLRHGSTQTDVLAVMNKYKPFLAKTGFMNTFRGLLPH